MPSTTHETPQKTHNKKHTAAAIHQFLQALPHNIKAAAENHLTTISSEGDAKYAEIISYVLTLQANNLPPTPSLQSPFKPSATPIRKVEDRLLHNSVFDRPQRDGMTDYTYIIKLKN